MPPPAASSAEVVDLSAGAAILEDPGPAATRTWVQILSCTGTTYVFVVCTLHMGVWPVLFCGTG